MPHHSRSRPLTRFFTGWLLAVAAFAALLVWSHAALTRQDVGRDTRQDTRQDASAAPASTASGAAPTEISLSPSPETVIPPFDADTATHVVTAFPMRGVQQLDDAAPALALFPATSELTAQVIERDSSPVVGGADLQARARLRDAYAGGRNNDAAVSFVPDEEGLAFTAEGVTVTPYASGEAGAFQPYPVAKVTVLDKDGATLAATGVVLPVSTETGCRNCHGGPWKDGVTGGIAPETAADILAVHDKRNATDLAALAKQGATVDCRSCHGGDGDQPNLSTAVHGFHAAMDLRGGDACGLCHASAENGATHFYRGYHALWDLDCTRCHGAMNDHALSLLRHEAERGNTAAVKRLAQIKPVAVADAGLIKPRQPGVNLPQCAGCHDFKLKPDASTATAFNKWTENEGERFTRALENTGTLRCPSCHGAPHTEYPSSSPAGDERDNIQPLQYQGTSMPLGKDGNCAVCHTHDMPDFVHHDTVAK